MVALRIGGQVIEVLVEDNQSVHTGQPLVVIDDREQRAALKQTQAALAVDVAHVAEAEAQLRRQLAIIRQGQAQVEMATARLRLAHADAERFAHLASTGAGTYQQQQQSDANLHKQQASVESARAEVASASTQLDALKADLDATRARVSMDEAQLTQASLNLSYTRLLAPIDGVVDQRSVQIGNFLPPGTTVMIVVPLERIYVNAYYREVALRHMRPGQHVLIHVDAYDMDLDGIIDSLPASTGAAFSPIPPNNASGNFTKIVQRLPVKIAFAPNQPLVTLVRVGMSVETTVDTHLENVVDEQRHDLAHVNGRP